ncbi:MAG: V-type ATPase subunit [Spirochaetes bacterium]|nr:V-type ATPase subunit [Spirochaetota bacterium]
MNSLADKVYVHAKIHALHGVLLSEEDYQEIARSGKIHAAFPDILTERDASDVVRTKEIVFRNQIKKFIRFIELNEFYSDFFRAFLLLFELSNVKYLLLKAYGRAPLFPQWNDVSPYNILDNRFRETEISPDDLPALFAGTVFSEAMEFDEPPSYETIEARIDLLALQNLLRFSGRLFPADLKIFNDVLTRRIVSLKIAWDLRREAYAAPGFTQIDLIEALHGAGIASRDIEPITKEIKGKIIGERSAAGEHEGGTGPFRPELLVTRLFMSHVRKIFSKDFHSIRPVISYAWSLYYQILNLFMVIEGLHLGAGPDTIMRRLVCGV